MIPMSEERNKTIDTMKIVATIMVVYVHSHNIIGYSGIEYEGRIIAFFSILANAGVPIFFLTSGYLMYNSSTDYIKNLRKKVKSLLVPYLLWIMIYTFLEIAGNYALTRDFRDIINRTALEWMEKIIGIPFVTSPVYAPFWFVRDLFILNLAMPLLKFAVRKIPTLVIFIGGGMVFTSSRIFQAGNLFLHAGTVMGCDEREKCTARQ